MFLEIQAFSIDKDSVQAIVKGSGQIHSVQYREMPVKDAPQEELRELDTAKREMLRDHRQKKNSRKIIDKQIQFLDSTLEYASCEIPKEIQTHFPNAEQMGTLVDFLDKRYSTLIARGEELDNQIQDLDHELQVLDRRIKKHRRSGSTSVKTIEIVFNASEDQEILIEASYNVSNASWAPFYKVEVADDLSDINLTLFARINQTTGENWEEAQLSVSNAIPLKGASLPDPKSWILRRPMPMPVYAGDSVSLEDMDVADGAVMASSGGSEEFEITDELAETPASYAQVSTQELRTAFEYRLSQTVSLESGDDEALLPLWQRSLDGDFHYQTVPRQDPISYLVCNADSDPELLPGPLHIHLGGRYVAGTKLGDQLAGEPLSLNLGGDRGLTARRELITDKAAESFFGKVDRGTVAREREYRIKLHNRKQQPVKVQLFDSIPISNTDRIQVKGLELKPEPNIRDWNEREGVMRWDMELTPGQEKEIRVHFFVKYPRNEQPDEL